MREQKQNSGVHASAEANGGQNAQSDPPGNVGEPKVNRIQKIHVIARVVPEGRKGSEGCHDEREDVVGEKEDDAFHDAANGDRHKQG